jgi:hypothetical protein
MRCFFELLRSCLSSSNRPPFDPMRIPGARWFNEWSTMQSIGSHCFWYIPISATLRFSPSSARRGAVIAPLNIKGWFTISRTRLIVPAVLCNQITERRSVEVNFERALKKEFTSDVARGGHGGRSLGRGADKGQVHLLRRSAATRGVTQAPRPVNRRTAYQECCRHWPRTPAPHPSASLRPPHPTPPAR